MTWKPGYGMYGIFQQSILFDQEGPGFLGTVYLTIYRGLFDILVGGGYQIVSRHQQYHDLSWSILAETSAVLEH